MLKFKRKPKPTIGLLPIQNSCSSILYSVCDAATLSLFPNKNLESKVANSTDKIKKYLDSKIEQIEEKAVDAQVSSCAHVPIHLFKSIMEKRPFKSEEIQLLFSSIVSEALEHFLDRSENRWTRTDFDVARGEIQAAHAITSALLPCYQDTTTYSQLYTLAQRLLLVEISLNSTTYDEQLALAEYDLAVAQHKINLSMRIIAICSIIVAIIALAFAVLNFLPNAESALSSLSNLLPQG